MANEMTTDQAKTFIRNIYPESYAWDSKRGSFDIIDVIDKDRAMAIGYGWNEDLAWIDAASRLTSLSSDTKTETPCINCGHPRECHEGKPCIFDSGQPICGNYKSAVPDSSPAAQNVDPLQNKPLCAHVLGYSNDGTPAICSRCGDVMLNPLTDEQVVTAAVRGAYVGEIQPDQFQVFAPNGEPLGLIGEDTFDAWNSARKNPAVKAYELVEPESTTPSTPPSPKTQDEDTQRLLDAINWVCGCGDSEFRQRMDGEGAYWWRSELVARAGLQYNGNKYEVSR